jgi:hypothetical protein
MGDECTYCGSDVRDHDPVYVNEGENDSDNQVGQFCNYACLTSHIEDETLTAGAACEWSPES